MTPSGTPSADAHEKRHQTEVQGGAEALHHELVDAPVAELERWPEVTLRQLDHPAAVLLPDRLAQVVLALDRGLDARCNLLFGGPWPAGHEVHQRERDDRHGEKDRDEPQDATDDVAGQLARYVGGKGRDLLRNRSTRAAAISVGERRT